MSSRQTPPPEKTRACQTINHPPVTLIIKHKTLQSTAQNNTHHHSINFCKITLFLQNRKIYFATLQNLCTFASTYGPPRVGAPQKY